MTILFIEQPFHPDFSFVDFRACNPNLLDHPLQFHGRFLRTGNLPPFLSDLGREHSALNVAGLAFPFVSSPHDPHQVQHSIQLPFLGNKGLSARRTGQGIEDAAEHLPVDFHFLCLLFSIGNRSDKPILDHIEGHRTDGIANPVPLKLLAIKNKVYNFRNIDFIQQFVRRRQIILFLAFDIIPVENVVQVISMPGNHIHNILIGSIPLQRMLKVGPVLAGRLFFAFAVGIHVQQEIFRVVYPGNSGFFLRIVSGTKHDIDFIRHGDITHSAHRTPRI